MLPQIEYGIKIIFLLFVTHAASERASSDRVDFLSRLLNVKKGPVVVFLEPTRGGTKITALDVVTNEEASQEDETEDDVYTPPPGEDDAYVLYNIMRTTQQEEDLDDGANEAFEQTKDLLRSAFALRCGKRQSCEVKCPPKVEKKCEVVCPEPTTCPKPKCPPKKCKKTCEVEEDPCQTKCQQKFDTFDACNEKPKCGPKCGRTMPPRWLRSLLRNA